jgi:methyl-accepting chemotaxis protein
MKTQTTAPERFKRRKIYINKDFQTRFIARFILVLIAGGIISVALTFFTTQGSLTSSFVNSRLIIQNTSLAILPSVVYTTLITILVVGIIVTLVTLVVSHKIAGPMYRFETDIQRITNGDLKSRIHIRKGDQFQEMAAILNTMVDSLNSEISGIQKTALILAEKENLPDDCRILVNALNQKIRTRFKL